jgi:hypothetical protein
MNILGFEIEVGAFSILGIAAVLAVIVIRQVVSRQSDRVIINEKSFIAEAIKFNDAFNDEIAFLVSDTKPQSSIHGTTYDILNKALNKHRHAIDVFKKILPKRKRRSLEKAWKEYLYPNGYNEKADFPLIDYEGGDEFEKRKLAHSKISSLLKYTELG